MEDREREREADREAEREAERERERERERGRAFTDSSATASSWARIRSAWTFDTSSARSALWSSSATRLCAAEA